MSLNCEILRKIDPQRYFEQFLSEGVYPDGRDCRQHRPINVETGVDRHASSSSFVRQDGTNILCSAQLSIAPDNSEPSISFEIEVLENVESQEILKNKEHLSSEKEMLCYLLEKNLFIHPECLQVTTCTTKSSSLSVTFNLKWSIQLKITVLSSNGFIFGAMLTAIQSCLVNISLPKITYEGEGALENIKSEDELQLQFNIENVKITESPDKTYLKLKEILVYVPLILWPSSNESIILCDPTMELKILSNDYMECIVGEDKMFYLLNICSLSKGTEPKMFQEICTVVQKRYRSVSNIIKKLYH